MNRNEEYMDLMKELDENVPEVQDSLQRGRRRKARKQFLYQPLMGLAAVFMLFVLSVNISAPVAKAFSNVPFLKELTKAVTFSKSLSDAIENDYVKETGLKQTKDEVTVEVTSIIVDRERLTVFYRFESDKYEKLAANCTLFDESGEDTLGTVSYEMGGVGIPNEEVRCVTADYITINMTDMIKMEAMPEKVQFHMVVWDGEAGERELFAGTNHVFDWEKAAEKYYITSFDFLLDLDPESMPEAKHYEVNQILKIDGQKLTVTDIQVYPTYMCVNVEDAAENAVSLKDLHFYVETEDGERFYNSGGVSFTIAVDSDTPTLISFETESPYFSDAESLKLVVTGAEWMEKGLERARVNLETEETSNLPENVTLKQIRKENETVYMVFEQQYEFMMDDRTGTMIGRKLTIDPFTTKYYDAEGEEYKGKCEIYLINKDDVLTGVCQFEYRLENYPYEEVWLENTYSSIWTAEEEISIVIK